MKYVLAVLCSAVMAVAFAAYAQTISVSPKVTLTIVPVVQSMPLNALSNCVVSGQDFNCNTGPTNANALLFTVGVVTNPPASPFSGSLTLSGADAAKFQLMSPATGCTIAAGKISCANLPTVAGGTILGAVALAATNVVAGTYQPVIGTGP